MRNLRDDGRAVGVKLERKLCEMSSVISIAKWSIPVTSVSWLCATDRNLKEETDVMNDSDFKELC